MAEKSSFMQIRLDAEQVEFFTSQLASMARLKMPLAKGVKILSEEVGDSRFESFLKRVHLDLEEGLPLSESLARFPESFTELHIQIVKVGEVSGNLGSILDELTRYSRTMQSIRSKIIEAILYPGVIGVTIFAFALAFLGFVTPKTKAMIATTLKNDFSNLTAPTRAVFAASDLLQAWYISVPLALLAVAGIFAFVMRLRQMGDSYSETLLKLPMFGSLFQRAVLMKLTRTMRELLANGMSMVASLRLTSTVVGDNRYKVKLEEITRQVEEGAPFAQHLAAGQVFPNTMVWKLQMAEEKGVIEEALGELSTEFENDVLREATVITKFISPLMLVAMGLVVFLLFISTFVPLMEITGRGY